jgi:2-keto-4-pentenoate hydratase
VKLANTRGVLDDQTVNDESRSMVADALAQAEKTCEPIAPLRLTWPEMGPEDAYAIQRQNVDDRVAAGARIRGHKVGLSSRAMQQMMGVHEPDYGHLVDDMFVFEHDQIDVKKLCDARVEIEVAFVLERGLSGPGITVADVLRATAYVLPSIEVIDSRIENWDCQLADTIADNASSARVVLGGKATSIGGLDLPTIGALLSTNGSIVDTGAAGAVLGNPAIAVAWLANTVGRFGVALEPGHIVLPGSCTRAFPVASGDHIRADFANLGSVSINFV